MQLILSVITFSDFLRFPVYNNNTVLYGYSYCTVGVEYSTVST